MRFDTAVNAMVLDLYKHKKINVNGRENKRPFIFIKDVVKAYLTIIDAPQEKIGGQIFNVGSNEQNVTMEELANKIVDSIDVSCEISINDTNDHRSYFASFEKLKNTLGFTTDYCITDGALEVYTALKSNQISDDLKTKTVEWYKHLLKNPESAQNLMINNTLL